MKDELSSKQFYLTPAHPCSYLDDRQARTLFLDPRDTIDQGIYGTLTRNGFRRSGSHLYRPHCQGCDACIPARVPVERFTWKRRFRRALRLNQDVEMRIVDARYSADYYDLYARYIRDRHGNGDMDPPSIEQFRSFLLSSWGRTAFLVLYLERRPVAVAVTDMLPDGLSAIYTFFDPEFADRGLGTYAVLRQIQLCQQRNLKHLYLGYWIKDCDKMNYKVDFRPIELFVKNRWVVMG
jgi:arginine-tRNA-protein transferase